MGKGRPRTPTPLLLMRNSFKKHPERKPQRGSEPTNIPELGPPPEHLTGDQKAAWEYIASICPEGVPLQSDRASLEIVARLYAEMVAGTIDRPGLKQLDGLLGKFGMNPSERSKVSAVPRPKINKFEGIG